MNSASIVGNRPRPVAEADRIAALDVARGVALLGILTVNIHYYGWPLGDVLATHTPPKGVSALEYGAWYYLRTFGEGKFFTVFSTLFGAGLTIQWIRARERGRGFGALAARRLGFLLLLGLLHGLLLWYGDILFVYACTGVLMLVPLLLKWSARTQIVVAVILLAFGSLLWGGVSLAEGWSTRATQQAQQSAEADSEQTETASSDPEQRIPTSSFESTPFGRLVTHWQSGYGTGGPDDPVWRDNEVLAYREGPWLQSFLFRAVTWMSMLFMVLMGFGFGVLAMFLAGSAMIKADVLRTAPDAFFRRMAAWGFALGVPASILCTALLWSPSAWLREFLANALFLPAGAAVATGTIALITLWTRSGRASWLAGLIANAGRFGLTNYLMQTVVCTYIFYHWGLGKFGTLGAPALLGIAASVWLAQVVLSTIAIRFLRYGPMEWLWRTFTYLQPQPLLRRHIAQDGRTPQ